MELLGAIAAKFLLGGKGLLHLAAAAFSWLLEEPIRGVLFVFALFVAAHQFVIDPRLRAETTSARSTSLKWQSVAAQWQDNANVWQDAHGKLLANVRTAQAAAAAADQANVYRVKREYSAINERTRDDYEARLADTGAALDRVRGQYAAIAGGDQGNGGGTDVPGALTARCQALGAADCNALLAALPDRLAAAEFNTGKLIDLQDYVRSSLLLDFSGGRP